MAARSPASRSDTWADLNGRWFFSWRMAAACEDALREVHLAMGRQRDAARLQALEKASQLFRRELLRWIRRGEALDMIVQHLPSPPGELEPIASDQPKRSGSPRNPDR